MFRSSAAADRRKTGTCGSQVSGWGEEARLRTDNLGLMEYMTGVLVGLADRLDDPLRSFVCDRLFFHFLELLAILREHGQVEVLEELWRKGG